MRALAWKDITSTPPSDNQRNPLFTRAQGCGELDGICVLAIIPRPIEQRFTVNLSIVDVVRSPSEVENYQAVAAIQAVDGLSACNVDGRSIPSGQSVVGFQAPSTQLCEPAREQCRRATSDVRC